MARTGKWILSDDWYPTTELYTVHHQLIMTPLFHIFDDYSIVYTITTSIAFILIAFTYYYFMRSFISSKIKSLLAVLLVCNPINSLLVFYSITFHGYLFFVLLGIIYITILFKLIYKKVNKFEKIMFMIISFLSGICGIRMFLIVFVPLVILLILKSKDFHFNKEILKIKEILKNKLIIEILCSYILAFIGFLTYYFILMPKFGGAHEFGTAGISNIDISNNIKDLILIILSSIGFNIEGKKILSTAFIKSFVILIFWLYVFSKNIILAVKYRGDKELHSLSLYNIICMCTTLLFMIFTIGNNEIIASLRYLGLSIYLFIPISIMGLEKINSTLKSLCLYGVIVIGIFVGLNSQINSIKMAKSLTSIREGYINFLDESEYSFGISTYWNANITTFMSKKEVEVAPVVSSTNLNLFTWNTRKSYEDKNPEFFILSTDEYKQRIEFGIEDEIIYQDDYYVIIALES